MKQSMNQGFEDSSQHQQKADKTRLAQSAFYDETPPDENLRCRRDLMAV